jgi:hypothetical protein
MPPTDPFARLYQILGPNLRDISGSTVTGEVPIADSLINRFIADALAVRQAPVTAVQLESRDEGRLLAHVTLRGPKFIPPVTVAIYVEEQAQFPDTPVVVLRWSLPKLGFLGNMAAPFISQLKSLPPGVRIEGERVLVDVAEMLRARGLGETVRYIRRLDIGARIGQVVVRFELSA